MNINLLKISGGVSLVVFWIWISSCDGTETVVPDGDFFPITRSTEKYFLREMFSSADPNELIFADTVRIAFTGDSLVNGRAYEVQTMFARHWTMGPRRIEVVERVDVLRKDGKQCYYVPGFAQHREFKFLDWSKVVGETWEYVEGFEEEFKFEFQVVGVHEHLSVRGVHFNNVVEIEQRGFYRSSSSKDYRPQSVERRWFANGVGEIRSEQQTMLPQTPGTRMFLLWVKRK